MTRPDVIVSADSPEASVQWPLCQKCHSLDTQIKGEACKRWVKKSMLHNILNLSVDQISRKILSGLMHYCMQFGKIQYQENIPSCTVLLFYFYQIVDSPFCLLIIFVMAQWHTAAFVSTNGFAIPPTRSYFFPKSSTDWTFLCDRYWADGVAGEDNQLHPGHGGLGLWLRRHWLRHIHQMAYVPYHTHFCHTSMVRNSEII